MRVTVDIDEKDIQLLGELTGERKMSPAINKAVKEFIRRGKAKEFGTALREGKLDLDPERPLTGDP